MHFTRHVLQVGAEQLGEVGVENVIANYRRLSIHVLANSLLTTGYVFGIRKMLVPAHQSGVNVLSYHSIATGLVTLRE